MTIKFLGIFNDQKFSDDMKEFPKLIDKKQSGKLVCKG